MLQPFEIIEKLKNQRIGYQYTGISISELPVYLAVDKNDWFTLVIPANDMHFSQFLSTDFVALRLGIICTLSTENGVIQNQRFHILQCKTTDESLSEMFVILCQALAMEIHEQTNIADIMVNFFNSLTQLFRVSPANDLTQERQGLWGELFVIYNIGSISSFTKFWHNETTRKFDFSCNNKRLEVKTTIRNERIHSFSHQQLFQNDSKEIVVASFMLRHEDSGLSLRELITEVKNVIINDTQSLLKLERAIRQAGMGSDDEIGPVFDEAEAKANLAWYNVENIPHFPQAEPAGVANTHYNVDLSTSPRMAEDEVKQWISSWA